MTKASWFKKKRTEINEELSLIEPKRTEPLINDFNLDNCPCDREKGYNPDCPLINKLDIPEEYQPAYQELFHVFAEPQLLKLIITDRILGKTTNKMLEILVKVALAIINKELILPYWIWLRRDYNDNVEKVMGEWQKVIRLFCLQYWKGEELQEKDFDSIYRGAFYNGKQYSKPQQFIYFYSIYDYDGPRGALLGNAQEIVFDECLPTEIAKYLVKDDMSEEEMFSEVLGGSYRTDKKTPVKLCFLGNPYDRFFYGFKNWQKKLEEWAKWYQKEKPTEFTIKEVKQFEDGDELIYLRKFPERRKLISKFKSIDTRAWENRFFVPKEEINMIDKPVKYFPLRMWFNGIVYAGIPRKTKKFFYTPYTDEAIAKSLPAWVFTSEEWYSCSQRDKYLKKASEESWRLAKKLAQREIAFADFESRSKVLEFISKHKYPHYNREPFQKMKTY